MRSSAREEAPLLPDAVLDLSEDEGVERDPDDEDDEHHGEQALAVRQLPVDLEELPERRLVSDDDDELAGKQAPPRERPTLLQAADEARQRRGQDHVAIQVDTSRAQGPAGPRQDRWDV